MITAGILGFVFGQLTLFFVKFHHAVPLFVTILDKCACPASELSETVLGSCCICELRRGNLSHVSIMVDIISFTGIWILV